MKTKKTFRSVVFLMVVSMFLVNSLTAAEELTMELSFWNFENESKEIHARLYYYGEEDEEFVEGLNVSFLFTDENGDEVELGTAISNSNGIAVFQVQNPEKIYKDEEAYMNFTARFEGTDEYEAVEEMLMAKDVFIKIYFEEEDGERQIRFEGKVFGPEGEMPLADDDLYLYVPRMFNDMKIADGWFEEDGTGYVEFPPSIIGDTLGNVMVIAKLEEHFDYGNVRVSGMIDWAVPKYAHDKQGPMRELWTPIAPLWMIITLIIMLAGVWGHYIYAIIQLRQIKKIGREQS